MKLYVLCLAMLLLCGCSQPKHEAPIAASREPEYFKVDAATSGTIDGVIQYIGKRPAPKWISMDAEAGCEKLHTRKVDGSGIVIGKGGTLSGVFVYIKSGLEGKVFQAPKQTVVLDQKGCMFVPRVVALQTGQTLQVKNSDPVSHNIHPNPQNNREWNQQQSPGVPDLNRSFLRPEIMIPVKCNVHSWMRSYVGVLEHPYFAVTGDEGVFALQSAPPGEYVVAAWHEKFGELTQRILLPPKQTVRVNFKFPGTAKPE